MQQQIEILPRHKINADKWDSCIFSSSNAIIYACSFYLDALCENWSGIIAGDYETVMPVPWRKKSGIAYTYTVPFVQQLGLFSSSSNTHTEPLLKKFFGAWKYGDYSFNFQNSVQLRNSRLCNNFVIPLSQSYKEMEAAYSQNLFENLKKAAKQNLVYTKEGDYETAIDLYETLYAERTPHVSHNDFTNFKSLCKNLSAKNRVIVRSVCNGANELLATALLLKDEKRLYNMMNSTTAAGRKTAANHFLFCYVLQEFSSSNLILDFEGSDIPGIKSFYEKFGAVNQPYTAIHFNHLPFPLRLFKK